MCLSRIARGFWGRARSVNADQVGEEILQTIKKHKTEANRKSFQAQRREFFRLPQYASKSGAQKITTALKTKATILENDS